MPNSWVIKLYGKNKTPACFISLSIRGVSKPRQLKVVMNMKIKWRSLLCSIAIPLVIGGLAALLTKDNMIMFDYLKKPPLAPPRWLFPVAWTILYVLMGAAAYLVAVSHKPKAQRCRALLLYSVQLVFNFFWPIIFFNGEKFLFAFIWLLIMLLFVLGTTLSFWRIDKRAGVFLLPYVLWTAFAVYLNYGIYTLNM